MALPLLAAGSAGLGVGINLYNAYQANQDRKRAQKQLDELSAQPFERYSVNPAMMRYYQTASSQAANPYGFSGTERNAFNQNINQQLNATRNLATNMTGGNLGKAINFLDTSGRLGAYNDFASRDAGLRRSFQSEAMGRQYQGAQAFQNIDNMNTQTALARRMQALQAYGQAVRGNKDYVRNTLGSMGSDLLTAGVMSYSGMPDFDGGEQDFTQTPSQITTTPTQPSRYDLYSRMQNRGGLGLMRPMPQTRLR